MKYYVVYEHGERNLSAYVPELPSVGVTGDSRDEVRHLIKRAIELQLAGLREDGLPVPEPSGEFVEVA